MKLKLTEKQIHNRLDKYYKKYYGEEYTDEWYINPNQYTWKFERDGKTITLIYDEKTGKVYEP